MQPFLRCLQRIPNRARPLMDFMLIEADCIAESEEPRHQECMRKLESMLPLGNVENPQSPEAQTTQADICST